MARRRPYKMNQVLWKTLLAELLVVPMNQRQYSWREEDVKKFWKDMVEFFENDKYTIQMGNIVHYKNDDSNQIAEVYEGQSRTLTTWMILVAIAQLYPSLVRSIHSILLVDLEVDTELCDHHRTLKNLGVQNVPKISCANDFDNNALIFIANMKIDDDSDKLAELVKQNEQSNMSHLYEAFAHITKWMRGLEYNLDRMRRFYNFILNDIDIQLCVSDDMEYVAQIFEWSNNRGRTVDPLDVVKNRVLCRVPADLKYQYYDKWVKMKRYTGSFQQFGEKLMDCAIQVYHGKLTHKKAIHTVDMYDSIVTADDIVAALDAFIAVVDDMHDVYVRITNDRFGRLLTKTCSIAWEGYSMLLLPCMFKLGYSPNLVRLFLNWAIRNTGITKRTFNSLSYAGRFMEITNEVLQAKITSMATVERRVSELFIDHADSQIATEDAYVRTMTDVDFTSKNAKSILLFYETCIGTDTYTPIEDVTLEHVLPQKGHALSSDKAYLIHRLGNMTLLEGKNSANGHKGNSSIQNSSYEKKCASYDKSSLKMTYMLSREYAAFGAAEVVTRTERLLRELYGMTKY